MAYARLVQGERRVESWGCQDGVRMQANAQYKGGQLDGANGDRASEEHSSLKAQLRAAADVIPGHVWYATPSGALVFTNSRSADYLQLPIDHPLRLGIDIGGAWDSHIPLSHPEDHEETRRVWSACLRSGSAGEVTFRVCDPEGNYRWFLSRAPARWRWKSHMLGWGKYRCYGATTANGGPAQK